MANYNKWIALGRLTKDPELRYTTGNMAVCSFSLAINHRYKDKSDQWVEQVSYFDCKIWGKRGEAFAAHHRRGSEAFVEGRLSQESWEAKDSGQKRSKIVAIIDNWEFVGGEKKQGGGQSQPAGNDDFLGSSGEAF